VRGRITVLVVDSDRDDLERTVEWLNAADYEAISAEDVNSGLRGLYNYHPDVVVFAADLAASDGWAGVQRIRDLSDIPIILVASRANQNSLQKAFSLQLDGYLVKPIEAEELLARLRALLRRTAPEDLGGLLTFADLALDPQTRQVTRSASLIELTKTEFDLLELLMLNTGIVLTREVIYDRIWGYDFGTSSNSLDVYIGYLRRKTEAGNKSRLIHTVRGVGYVLRES